ncbi:uncharacterized protein LOC142224465 [Haematobia irritans]|uniref:uncharacterized protein LOC142224465 n=1 Tax=Haematobia irritans TaxID=7368 RepID=UPI003F4F628D
MVFYRFMIKILILMLAATKTESMKIMEENLNTTSFRLLNMLKEIYKEQQFHSILVMQRTSILDEYLDPVFQYPIPKIFYNRNGKGFEFKPLYNSEILVVIGMTVAVDEMLMETAATSLNYMRESRILLLAKDIKDRNEFKDGILKLCQNYKFTNFLIHFPEMKTNSNMQYDQLKPYPRYQWHVLERDVIGLTRNLYFPQHWRNMEKATILTYSDQHFPHSIYYQDNLGQYKLSGYVARLVQLFGEFFNASVTMYEPLKLNEERHFSMVTKLVEENLIDIPMAMDISGPCPKWLHRSYPYEISYVMLIVPCSQALRVKEIFGVLLDGHFLGSLIIYVILFSFVLALVDYRLENVYNFSNFLFNERVLPAILGQSFIASLANWRCLKIIYLVLFFTGLNFSIRFSANMQTLLTTPPYHRQIRTVSDIQDSDVPLILLRDDLPMMGGMFMPIYRSVHIIDNVTQYDGMRLGSNSTVAFASGLSQWKILNMRQRYLTHKIFCTYDDMIIFRLIPWALLLQEHSPYKEPLDYLIHQIHAMGFLNAWQSHAFSDTLKLKKISLQYPNINRNGDPKPLSTDDLCWVWMLVIIGMTISASVFIMELLYYSQYRVVS